MLQRHIGFLVVSNRRHQDFRYPLIRHDLDHAGGSHAVKTPGMNTVPVSLTAARKQGAKLLLTFDLDAETKAKVQKIWGK